MIHSLRKRHRYTWIGLAFLLPIGFVLAFISIPEKIVDSNGLDFGQAEALVDVVKSKDGNTFNVKLRTGADKGMQQIEVEVVQPLKSAAASVYLHSQALDQPNGGQLIGQLGPKGVYRFDLDTLQSKFSTVHLLIYDHIKGQAIEQISL